MHFGCIRRVVVAFVLGVSFLGTMGVRAESAVSLDSTLYRERALQIYQCAYLGQCDRLRRAMGLDRPDPGFETFYKTLKALEIPYEKLDIKPHVWLTDNSGFHPGSPLYKKQKPLKLSSPKETIAHLSPAC